MKKLVTSGWAVGTAVALLALSTEAALSATVAPGVPEINGSVMSSALAILAGGILVVRARRRSK